MTGQAARGHSLDTHCEPCMQRGGCLGSIVGLEGVGQRVPGPRQAVTVDGACGGLLAYCLGCCLDHFICDGGWHVARRRLRSWSSVASSLRKEKSARNAGRAGLMAWVLP